MAKKIRRGTRTKCSTFGTYLGSVVRLHSDNRSEIAQKQRKYPINLNFFNHLDAESCYWLGFISADGCVHYDKRWWKYGLVITIKKDDVSHLIPLQNKLCNTPFQISKKDNVAQYQCSSKKLAKQLMELGIHPRKSLTNTYPNCIPIKHHQDFIRGYIDGDGSYSMGTTRQGKLRLQLSLVGTKEFLIKVKEIIDSYHFGMDVNLHRDRPNSNLWCLSYNHKENIINLLRWLYYPDCECLKRKREIVYKYAQMKGVEI